MKTTNEMIEVMQAYVDGKLIEVCHDNVWHPLGVFGAPDWSWGRYDYRIASPKIASGHNPAKLTDEQVGIKDGWRLLEEDEICSCFVSLSDIQIWNGYWDSTGWIGSCGYSTYRTKLSKQELHIARGFERVIQKDTPRSPEPNDWFITAPNWKHYQRPKILKDGSGTTLGTWKQMNDAGVLWSEDGNVWKDFTGKEVQNEREEDSAPKFALGDIVWVNKSKIHCNILQKCECRAIVMEYSEVQEMFLYSLLIPSRDGKSVEKCSWYDERDLEYLCHLPREKIRYVMNYENDPSVAIEALSVPVDKS